MKPAKQNVDSRIKSVVCHIRKLRKEQGYSQDEFAAVIDTGRAHYGRIERGEVNITLHTLYRIADALTISADELLRQSQ